MPTILRKKGYRFFFFSREGNEPKHIHIEKAEKYAKFWIDNAQLAESDGFRSWEISELRNIVIENKILFVEKWDEHFRNKN